MPLTPTCQRMGNTSWKYEWAGTAPYDVYKDGMLVLDQSDLVSLVVNGSNRHTPPAIEIFDADDTTTPQSVLYSPRMRMQWRGQADADLYIIQEYVSAAWTDRQKVRENGQGYYNFTTTPLPDGSAAQWRVLAQDARGHRSDAINFTVTICRNPAPPAVAFAYDEDTTTLTVSAAA